jgi:hypothetical protein
MTERYVTTGSSPGGENERYNGKRSDDFSNRFQKALFGYFDFDSPSLKKKVDQGSHFEFDNYDH